MLAPHRAGAYGPLAFVLSLLLLSNAGVAWGQSARNGEFRRDQQRVVYNPVTQRAEVEALPWRQPSRASSRGQSADKRQPRRQAQPQRQREPQEVAPVDYEENFRATSCGPQCGCPDCYAASCNQGGCDQGGYEMGSCDTCYDACCDDCCDDCCETVCCGSVCGGAAGGCYVGFEATFLKPHYERNIAFNEDETVDTGNTNTSQVDFFADNYEYNTEFSPRVFVGWENCCGVGVRATWWQFDHGADLINVRPIATSNIATPVFGESTATSPNNVGRGLAILADPTQALSLQTGIDAYSIDIEGTKATNFCCWDLGVGCGIRYARVEHSTRGTTVDDQDGQIGDLAYRQSLEGIGPTISLYAFRPLSCQCGVFGRARGSLLFGDGDSSLTTTLTDVAAGATGTFNEAVTRDDVLPIFEMQVGWQWQGATPVYATYVPFATIALEGQFWHGAGNASSEDGSLGFFGVTSGMGVRW